MRFLFRGGPQRRRRRDSGHGAQREGEGQGGAIDAAYRRRSASRERTADTAGVRQVGCPTNAHQRGFGILKSKGESLLFTLSGVVSSFVYSSGTSWPLPMACTTTLLSPRIIPSLGPKV